MDKDTKAYIDAKLAGVTQEADALRLQQRRATLRVVLVCTVILLALLGFACYMLYRYQLRGFVR